MSYDNTNRKQISGSTSKICESASTYTYDPFLDYRWEWKPHLRHRRKVQRKLKPLTYRQLVDFMMHEPL